MSSEKIHVMLTHILADTYALYLKTQNYHWHVTGMHFKSLHELFEEQYSALGEAIDTLAERLRSLGFQVPATFKELQALCSLVDGQATASSSQMIQHLTQDHQELAFQCKNLHQIASEEGDEATAGLMSDRIRAHEKARWILAVSV